MKAVKLATFEFRRQRRPLQRLALLFAVLVPLAAAAAYLWSTWDPYGRSDRIPVAVVNNDRPVEVDGVRVSAGEQFTEALRRQRTFDWNITDGRDARTGLAEGRYYLVLTVPSDFSADATRGTAGRSGLAPERAVVRMRVDDGNGYLFTVMARAARATIIRQVDEAATAAYLESVYGRLGRFRAGLVDARGVADQLRGDVERERKGAARLARGLGRLQADSAGLTSGTEQVAAGNRRLADVAPAMGQLADALPGTAAQAAAVADSGTNLAGLVGGGADSLAGRQRGVEDAVARLGREHPELRGDPAYQSLGQRSAAVTQRVGSVSDTTAGLNSDAQRLSGSAQTLATQAARLRQTLGPTTSEVRQVAATAEQTAATAARLDAGLARAASQAQRLEAGAARSRGGAGELASALSNAVDQIPDLSPRQRERQARVLGSPAAVTLAADHPARVYGRGLAPFLFALALWVFGAAAFLLLRPVTGRLLAARAGNLTVALAGWLPLLGVGVLGGLVLFGFCEAVLGLDAVRPLWAAGFVALAAAAFTAITHLLRVALGAAGSAVALVLLVLQAIACGGLYPVETLPTPLRVLHPYLPMTYVVDGFRVTMTGGNVDHLVRAAVVLGGCAVGAFALMIVVVARRRVWSVRRLHPVLAT